MIRSLIPILALYLLSGCNSDSKTDTSINDTTVSVSRDTIPTTVVGNDTDDHGCKASAGENWSVVRKSCVRIFEVGLKMQAQATGMDTALAAFAVFPGDEDDSKVEIFLPSQKKSVVLPNTSGPNTAGIWSSGSLTLKQWKGMYTLTDGEKVIYEGFAGK